MKKEINELIEAELQFATERFGSKFNSMHEAWAVLKEEVEEASAEMASCKMSVAGMWQSVKSDKECGMFLKFIELSAQRLIEEAIQVAAMCRKARR